MAVGLVELLVHLAHFQEGVPDQSRVPGHLLIELLDLFWTEIGGLSHQLAIEPHILLRNGCTLLPFPVLVLHALAGGWLVDAKGPVGACLSVYLDQRLHQFLVLLLPAGFLALLPFLLEQVAVSVAEPVVYGGRGEQQLAIMGRPVEEIVVEPRLGVLYEGVHRNNNLLATHQANTQRVRIRRG